MSEKKDYYAIRLPRKSIWAWIGVVGSLASILALLLYFIDREGDASLEAGAAADEAVQSVPLPQQSTAFGEGGNNSVVSGENNQVISISGDGNQVVAGISNSKPETDKERD